MAAITERNGRYLVRVRRQGYATVTRTFTRKTDALAWARRVEVDMEAGRWAPELQSIPTLREVIQEYRQVVAPKLKGASTYRYRFDEFERLPFANLSVNEIQSAHLARWRDQQAERLKAGTVIRKLAMLSSVFRWAQMERGWVDSNPLSTVRRPRSDQGRSRTLSSLETEWLLHAAKSSKASWLHPALIVLMRSAMRRGELCQLRIRDIDSAQATAFLADTKNGSARYVPLCPQSLAALLALADAARGRGDELLLPTGAAGSVSTRFKVTVARAQRMFDQAVQEGLQEPIGGFLSDLRLHDLRHHAVTAWTSLGSLSLAELMAISGHKSTRMLLRYTHLQATSVAQRLASLSGRQDPPS